MFTVTVSRSLSVAEVAAVCARWVVPGPELVVQAPGAEVPDVVGRLWAGLEPTGDPAWPLGLVVHLHPRDLGPCPDLRFAEHLRERYGVDVLCGVPPSLVDVDPYDPYYALALVGGRWHLASTAGTRLMGPYDVRGGGGDGDGSAATVPGDEPVRLIRPVAVGLEVVGGA
ncbi:hypothetical protein ACIQPQ_03005 [Streptomyces sp. NPDC091281]|uniref:hypothetical protein n=1 Tax=Streptomyces sp. NPDC091281 TaxID=3365985 RepID=UPI003808D3B9